jgi:hypothetical protein
MSQAGVETPHQRKQKAICPRCKLPMERISRHIVVKMVLFWLSLKRYKCGHCGQKMYVRG